MRALGKREYLPLRLFPEIKKRLLFVAAEKGMTVNDYVTQLIGKETMKNPKVQQELNLTQERAIAIKSIIVPAAKKVAARKRKAEGQRATSK